MKTKRNLTKTDIKQSLIQSGEKVCLLRFLPDQIFRTTSHKQINQFNIKGLSLDICNEAEDRQEEETGEGEDISVETEAVDDNDNYDDDDDLKNNLLIKNYNFTSIKYPRNTTLTVFNILLDYNEINDLLTKDKNPLTLTFVQKIMTILKAHSKIIFRIEKELDDFEELIYLIMYIYNYYYNLGVDNKKYFLIYKYKNCENLKLATDCCQEYYDNNTIFDSYRKTMEEIIDKHRYNNVVTKRLGGSKLAGILKKHKLINPVHHKLPNIRHLLANLLKMIRENSCEKNIKNFDEALYYFKHALSASQTLVSFSPKTSIHTIVCNPNFELKICGGGNEKDKPFTAKVDLFLDHLVDENTRNLRGSELEGELYDIRYKCIQAVLYDLFRKVKLDNTVTMVIHNEFYNNNTSIYTWLNQILSTLLEDEKYRQNPGETATDDTYMYYKFYNNEWLEECEKIEEEELATVYETQQTTYKRSISDGSNDDDDDDDDRKKNRKKSRKTKKIKKNKNQETQT